MYFSHTVGFIHMYLLHTWWRVPSYSKCSTCGLLLPWQQTRTWCWASVRLLCDSVLWCLQTGHTYTQKFICVNSLCSFYRSVHPSTHHSSTHHSSTHPYILLLMRLPIHAHICTTTNHWSGDVFLHASYLELATAGVTAPPFDRVITCFAALLVFAHRVIGPAHPDRVRGESHCLHAYRGDHGSGRIWDGGGKIIKEMEQIIVWWVNGICDNTETHISKGRGDLWVVQTSKIKCKHAATKWQWARREEERKKIMEW